MDSAKISSATLEACLLNSATAIGIVFGSAFWPFIVPICVVIAIIGLVMSGKKQPGREWVEKARWQVTAKSMLLGVLVFVIASIVAGSQEESGLLAIGLFIVGMFTLPVYFGLAYIVAATRIR